MDYSSKNFYVQLLITKFKNYSFKAVANSSSSLFDLIKELFVLQSS